MRPVRRRAEPLQINGGPEYQQEQSAPYTIEREQQGHKQQQARNIDQEIESRDVNMIELALGNLRPRAHQH